MNHRDAFFLAVVLSAGAIGGCSLTTNACTAEARSHELAMARKVTTSDRVDSLLVEACFDGVCRSATPDASGKLTFTTELGAIGPLRGSVATTGAPNEKDVTVSYLAIEKTANATTELQLRVKSGTTTLLDERATAQWEDEDCHPEPRATKL